MAYSRSDYERMVLGIILNDDGEYGFMKSCRMSLRKELFKDKKNIFVYGILDAMYNDGCVDMTPISVFDYANNHNIKYGNMGNFAAYLCELSSTTWRFHELKKYVKELVTRYMKERFYNGTK